MFVFDPSLHHLSSPSSYSACILPLFLSKTATTVTLICFKMPTGLSTNPRVVKARDERRKRKEEGGYEYELQLASGRERKAKFDSMQKLKNSDEWKLGNDQTRQRLELQCEATVKADLWKKRKPVEWIEIEERRKRARENEKEALENLTSNLKKAVEKSSNLVTQVTVFSNNILQKIPNLKTERTAWVVFSPYYTSSYFHP